MVASKIKKDTKSVTSFEVGKMYIQDGGDMVVIYTGEGYHCSTFSGIVLHSTNHRFKIFDNAGCFSRTAFSEFHGEITLTS